MQKIEVKLKKENKDACVCGETRTQIKLTECTQMVVCSNCGAIRYKFQF